VTPLDATNRVNEPHTITATVQQDDGIAAPGGDNVDGFGPAPDGTTVTFSFVTNTAGAFFVGGVDTQDLLPHGTADEVYAATARLIDGMTADGGGYILAASHSIPPETPDDNIFAMYAAAGLSREEIYDRASDIRWRLQPNP
jgi:uroporphyrinogen-III decarboxylase